MMQFVAVRSRRAVALGCTALLLGGIALQPVFARSGPFVNFKGNWSGSGIIRIKDQDNKQTTERMRCSAAYRPNGDYDIDLTLSCKSDNYDLDLTGDLAADAKNNVTGQWTEHTRNIGGNITGRIRGGSLMMHAESPVLNANLSMVTHRHSQSVRISAAGGGRWLTAAIRLRRR